VNSQELRSLVEDGGVFPCRLCEVGVNAPELAQIKSWLDDDKYEDAMLVEPLQMHYDALMSLYGENTKVRIVRAACTDRSSSGMTCCNMWESDQGSYVDTIDDKDAPTIMYDLHRPSNKITVPSCGFGYIDDGKIDLIAIDVEGSEWSVIKHMRSRPKIIVLETHLVGKRGVHQDIDPITRWMVSQGYVIIHITESDMVWELSA